VAYAVVAVIAILALIGAATYYDDRTITSSGTIPAARTSLV
jgi:hypothetical protein